MESNFENYVLFEILNSPHDELKSIILDLYPNDYDYYSKIHFGDSTFRGRVIKYLSKAKNTKVEFNADDSYYKIGPMILVQQEENFVFRITSHAKQKNPFAKRSKYVATSFFHNPTICDGLSALVTVAYYYDYSEYIKAMERCIDKYNLPNYPFDKVSVSKDGAYCHGEGITYNVYFKHESSTDGIIGLVKQDTWKIITVYRIFKPIIY